MPSIAPIASGLAQAAPPVAGPPVAPQPPSTGFGEAVGHAALEAVETLRAAEAASAGAMTGEIGVREAVDRVMEAERTLRAAVSVRDKLVSGWLDVSRMQI